MAIQIPPPSFNDKSSVQTSLGTIILRSWNVGEITDYQRFCKSNPDTIAKAKFFISQVGALADNPDNTNDCHPLSKQQILSLTSEDVELLAAAYIDSGHFDDYLNKRKDDENPILAMKDGESSTQHLTYLLDAACQQIGKTVAATQRIFQVQAKLQSLFNQTNALHKLQAFLKPLTLPSYNFSTLFKAQDALRKSALGSSLGELQTRTAKLSEAISRTSEFELNTADRGNFSSQVKAQVDRQAEELERQRAIHDMAIESAQSLRSLVDAANEFMKDSAIRSRQEDIFKRSSIKIATISAVVGAVALIFTAAGTAWSVYHTLNRSDEEILKSIDKQIGQVFFLCSNQNKFINNDCLFSNRKVDFMPFVPPTSFFLSSHDTHANSE